MRERGSTIERILAILEQVTDTDQPISAREINQALALPRSTAHRLCSMMEEYGFLQRHADGKRFLPGPKMRKLAVGVLGHAGHRAEQQAILTSFAASAADWQPGSGLLHCEWQDVSQFIAKATTREGAKVSATDPAYI